MKKFFNNMFKDNFRVIKWCIVLVSFILMNCKDPWENYINIKEEILTKNIIEYVASKPEFSEFYDLLVKTGYDSILSINQSYTLWIPDNDAMNVIDENVLKDSAFLCLFVSNHFNYTKIVFGRGNEISRKIKFYSGKNLVVDYLNKKIDNIKVKESNIVVKNGIIHVIEKPLIPKNNIWQYVENLELCPKYVGYLNSLSKYVFDPSVAIQIGFDPLTGKPIYDTASGIVWKNDYILNVRDLRNEDLESTLILITDNVFDQEYEKFSKYYVGTTQQKTYQLTSWNIAKDLVFEGIYTIDNIPDTLLSLYGTKVPFNKNAIDTIIYASNGIIYVLNDCSVKLSDKIRPIIIEGEDSTKIVYVGTGGYTGYTRKRVLASGGYDFVLDRHLGNPGYIRYKLPPLVATTYKVYWKAVNDFGGRINGTAYTTLQQSLTTVQEIGKRGTSPVFSDPADPPLASLVTVTDTNYENSTEVFLCEWNLLYYFDNFWFQINSGNRDMAITLDYIKLVPILNK